MKLLILCSVLINVSLTIAGRHGFLTGPRDGRIIGGYDASPRSHPYLVSLQMRFLWARMRLCSGSLLNERWILTAGHCVKGSWFLNWLTMEAVVGTNNLDKKDSTAQTVRISERIPHPNYNGQMRLFTIMSQDGNARAIPPVLQAFIGYGYRLPTGGPGIGAYDIAMLKTAKNIEYNNAVSPIEVPLSMGSLTHKTQNLVLAGWGVLETTVFIPALPDKLQEARVEYLPFDECNKAIDAIKEPYEDNPLDRAANICTGPITGGVAACSGDSGGPLIQYISYNELEITTATTQSATEEETTHESTSWTANISENEVDSTFTTQNKESSTSSTPTIKAPAVADLAHNYDDEGLIPVVIGVVSWGISPCGEVGAPTVYTNVSTYAEFIYNHLYN